MTNILIGNGVNQCANSYLLSSEAINKRFKKTLLDNYLLIQNDELKDVIKHNITKLDFSSKDNIEIMSARFFDLIKDWFLQKYGYFLVNHNQRMIRTIKKSALEAIFLDESLGLIEITIPEKITNKLKAYKDVFTLNYYEFWDDAFPIHYLHGKITRQKNPVSIIGINDCAFSPILDGKKSEVEALLPGKYLAPANDLYPMGAKILYKELEGLDEIDIFGVSPYGDEELIQNIEKIRKKNIFVYEMNDQQVNFWKSKVSNAEYINANEFE